MKPLLIKFLCIRFLSTLGDQVLLFVVPLLVYKATNSISLSGLAFFIEWMPRVLSLPFAGIFSDKLGGKFVYVLGDMARSMLCVIALIFLYLVPQYSFIVLSVLMALCAICYAQTFIAQETTIPLIVKGEYIHKAQSIIQSIEQLTVILGPLFCSLSLHWVSLKTLLIIASLIFFMSSACMSCLSNLSVSSPMIYAERRSRIFHDMMCGLNIILNSKELLWLCLMTASVNLMWGMSLATGAAMITGVYAKSASSYGYLQSAVGILCILFITVSYIFMNRISVRSIGMISYLLMCVGSLLIGYKHSYILFLIGYVLTLSLDGVFNVFIRTERLKIIPKDDLGKTIGLIVLINQLSVPLAGILVAKYSSTVGVDRIYLFIGCLASTIMIMYVSFLMKHNPETMDECDHLSANYSAVDI